MLDADHRGDIDDGSIDSLERLYDEAVCAGGALSGCPADEERLHSALELLAQITTPAQAARRGAVSLTRLRYAAIAAVVRLSSVPWPLAERSRAPVCAPTRSPGPPGPSDGARTPRHAPSLRRA